MYLTREEEKMYAGEHGPAVEKSMEILVALGDIYGADGMVEIVSAQISGVSYKTIGDAGLEYLEELASEGAQVKVPSTLNPAGVDLDHWKDLGFPPEFTKKQLLIVEAYRKMGISTTCTCTPYLVGNVPPLGSHIAWSESSAVCYANSVLGARTNREGGPGALSAAICGRTPNYGYHLDQGRVPNLLVEVEAPLTGSDYGALGYLVGKAVGNGVPYFKLLDKPQIKPQVNQLKALGAALASSGAVALYHMENTTPEYQSALEHTENLEKLSVTREDLDNTREKLSTAQNPDLVCLGCPHASLEEIKEVALKLDGKKLANQLWVCTSISVKAASDRMGYTKIIEKAGGRVVCDTCMVVAPIEDMGFKVIGVNSAKAANYVPSMCGLDVVFDDWENLIALKK
ncbi:aconitase X catalytic domain-containing protein [Methanobacterium sp.]|uniref:aconitase X catalytic domain-containing protein n=1 Tax=Methanobacterium sp. TaxID=2164 RepID=UPI0025E2972D|nr:aconitase X catalytic domain-containing protein [Methanobacterium sp.]MBI5460086.1 aconitase X catalytic domain-containing protein [Methanobacterium sp.]